MEQHSINLDGDIVLNETVQLDMAELVQWLVTNPDFINQVRQALLKDARKMGNTMGKWAQAQPAAPSQQRRLS